jgi:predicted RNase H-like nuclease (RuvC/YqgF family)
MPQLSIAEAARLVGKDRRTIERQMKDGRLSYTTNAAGARVLDTSELIRVFGSLSIKDSDNAAQAESTSRHGMPHHENEQEIIELRVRLAAADAENAALKERVADLKTQQEQLGTALRLLEFKAEAEVPKEKKKRFFGIF